MGFTGHARLLIWALSCFQGFTLLALAHEQTLPRGLPSDKWYQTGNHPAHNLFRRGAQTFQTVGSPSWSAAYPVSTPDVSKMPAAWNNALVAAVAANKIPNIPIPTATTGLPAYPPNVDPLSPEICSASDKCPAPGDVWSAPDNTIGIGFDDGPVPNYSSSLYAFLKSTNQTATHFMIGLAILQSPSVFMEAFNNGDDIAVHTYTHPYMTTLSNEDIVAQLGWTMQIIYDSTQGRLPKFWRPPYGNMDNRVRAIAREIFGLTPIIWNQDSEDWSIGQANGTTPAQVATNLNTWITGPKSPGLVILQHELSNQSVQAYINAYPAMKSNGWKPVSVAQIASSSMDNVTGQVYWNAPPGNGGRISPVGLLAHGKFANAPPAPAPTPSTTSSTVLVTSSPATQNTPAPGTTTTSSNTPNIPLNHSSRGTSHPVSLLWLFIFLVPRTLLGALL